MSEMKSSELPLASSPLQIKEDPDRTSELPLISSSLQIKEDPDRPTIIIQNDFINDQMKKIFLIDNLNSTTFTHIAPSKIHGVGVFASRKIPAGVDPFNLPEDYVPQGTVDFSVDEVKKLKCHAKTFIQKFLTPFEKNGTLHYCVPICGANGIDLSFYLNSSKDTGMYHNVEPSEELDARGYSKLITLRDIEEGEELILEYNSSVNNFGRTSQTYKKKGDEEDTCLVCNDSLLGKESISLPCCSVSIFCSKCGPTWFAGHCKILFEHRPANLQKQGCAKITNRWELRPPSIECPVCHKNLPGLVAEEILRESYASGGFTKDLEKFEGKKVSLDMKETEDQSDSDSESESSSDGSYYEPEPQPVLMRRAGKGCGCSVRRSTGGRAPRRVPRRAPRTRLRARRRAMTTRTEYLLRSNFSRAWRPKARVWKTGTNVRVFMADDGVWVSGYIAGWLSSQQRKDKHLADIQKKKKNPRKKTDAHCPNYKRGMYKVRWRKITENDSEVSDYDEDWFSDGDATLEKIPKA